MEKIVQGIDVKDCEYIYTDRDNDLCCAASIGGDSLCDPAQMMCNKYLDHLKKQIAPFKDKYFQGLDMEAIAELAKKSIRLTTENRELEDENEKLKIQLMQNSEVNTFCNTPIKGWSNDPCKVCQYKQDYQAKDQECEELKEKLDKYLDQEEEEIRQLNNDNKLDEILESIKKANEQIAKEIKYKKALEAIETYCNVILTDRCHYSEGAILMTEKLMREYISKTKE